MRWTVRVRFQAWQYFSIPHGVHTDSGVHQAAYPVGNGGDFPGVKWPGHEADHSPPSSAEVKNGGAIPTLTHMYIYH
jgi:hypothetical protein